MKRKQMDPMPKIATRNIDASRLQREGLTPKDTFAGKGFFASVERNALKRIGLA